MLEPLKFEFEKGSRDHNKSKETSSQLKPVRNSCVAIMHQPVSVTSNMESNAYINKAFPSTSTRFNPTLTGVVTYIFYTSQSRD